MDGIIEGAITDERLEQMWGEFRNIPINDRDEIEEQFYHWQPGTDRFDIWRWFDERHSKGVAWLIQRRTRDRRR